MKVATFYTPKPGFPPSISRIEAWICYDPLWYGCVVHDIRAKTDREAKKLACLERLATEQRKLIKKGPSNAN